MINLMAPINQLGYGIAGMNILKALQANTDVTLSIIGQPQVTNQVDADVVKKALQDALMFDPKAPCVKIWHQNQLAEFVGKGPHIGFPIFELDKFDNIEIHHLKSCDRIFVCSKWARDVMHEQLGVTAHQVDVIPLGVDSSVFQPVEPVKKDKIIFFNCGKWEVRKGHDILIKAFKKIADKYENVELWMMCQNPFKSEDEENRWKQLYNHPKVRLISRVESQEQVYNIMREVDCGVFPSRGEGWNLELLELMSIGKHVIATDYSAHTEFCNESNSLLVPIKDVEPAFDGKWFFGQGNWGKIDDLAMESLHNNMEKFIQEKLGTLNEAGIETARQFSWQNTAESILNVI